MAEEIVYNVVTQPPLAYEGASTSYRNGLRGLLSGEPDSLAAREVQYLQMRSEHAIRNNGYARSALNKYVTNLDAVKVTWKDAEGKTHPIMQPLWDEFYANPNLDGFGTLANTQSVWHSSMFMAGAAFTRFHIRRRGNKNKIPLKLQGIPAAMHDIGYMGMDASQDTRFGIKFEDTRPIEYYFRKGIYEQNWLESTTVYPQVVVPAHELVHIFIRDTPGQWIGVPNLTPCLLLLYELDELNDATIAKQKAAQAIAWIIENTNPLAMTPTGSATTVKDKDQKDKVVFKAQGGSTQYLNKGEKIHFYQSTDIGANLQVLIRAELNRIAASLDIPYHQLTGDTSGLDFSSIRALAIELRNRLEYIHHFCTIPLGLVPITERFQDLAKLYDVRVADARPHFQLPRWRGIDDLKDTQADLLEIQSGFSTLEEKLEERGTSFEKIVADRKRIKELGLDHILEPNGKANAQSNNIESNSNSTGN